MLKRCSTRIQDRPPFRQISTLTKQIGYAGQLSNNTVKEIKQELRNAISEYVRSKPDRFEQRKTFTKALAADRSQIDGKPLRSHTL